MDMRDLIAKMTAIEEESKKDKEYDHDSLDKDDEDYIEKNSKSDSDEKEYEPGEEDEESDKEVKESVEHDEKDEESEEETVNECGGEMTSMPMHSDQSDTVSMTINMSGSGKGGIHDILDVIRNIEKGNPAANSPIPPVGDKELNRDATMIIGATGDHEKLSDDFDNAPDVKYASLKHITNMGSSERAHAYPPTSAGNNPMAVKEKLESLYQFVKNK